MDTINYEGRRFRTIQNSGSGEAGSATVFTYHQLDNLVWAEYSGGEIIRGHLLAVYDADGRLDMRYHHINSRGELLTGVCRSTPELLRDGRVRLHESWKWTSGDMSSGESVLEEF